MVTLAREEAASRSEVRCYHVEFAPADLSFSSHLSGPCDLGGTSIHTVVRLGFLWTTRAIQLLSAYFTPPTTAMLSFRSVSRLASTPSRLAALRAYATRAQPSGLNEGETTIWTKLNDRFPGTRLEVQDVSGA